MNQRDTRDIAGGLCVAAIGIFAILYSQQYRFGQLHQMGPGFFPTVIGGVLVVFGLLIAIPALFREGSHIAFQPKSFAVVILSLVVFGATLEKLGLPLAAALTAFLSTSASQLKFKSKLLLALAIASITYAIFIFALSMPIPVWPDLGRVM